MSGGRSVTGSRGSDRLVTGGRGGGVGADGQQACNDQDEDAVHMEFLRGVVMVGGVRFDTHIIFRCRVCCFSVGAGGWLHEMLGHFI